MRFWFIAESAVSDLGVLFSVVCMYFVRSLLLLLFILIDTGEML